MLVPFILEVPKRKRGAGGALGKKRGKQRKGVSEVDLFYNRVREGRKERKKANDQANPLRFPEAKKRKEKQKRKKEGNGRLRVLPLRKPEEEKEGKKGTGMLHPM